MSSSILETTALQILNTHFHYPLLNNVDCRDCCHIFIHFITVNPDFVKPTQTQLTIFPNVLITNSKYSLTLHAQICINNHHYFESYITGTRRGTLLPSLITLLLSTSWIFSWTFDWPIYTCLYVHVCIYYYSSFTVFFMAIFCIFFNTFSHYSRVSFLEFSFMSPIFSAFASLSVEVFYSVYHFHYIVTMFWYANSLCN